MKFMKSSQYVALFVDEAGLLLEQCHNCLEQLEANPGEPELYRELFRLVHTLKGMASTLADLPYFEDITHLSHCVESLLEQYKYSLIQEQLYLLADSMQALSDLTNNVAHPEQAAMPALESLYQRFMQYSPLEPFMPVSHEYEEFTSFELNAAERDQAEELQLQGLSLHQVQIELMQACLMKSVRALLVVHKLEQQTEIIATQPPMALLRDGAFDTRFSILVASTLDAEDLSELASSVSEIEEVDVQPFASAAQAPAAYQPESKAQEHELLNEFELRLLQEAKRMDFNAVWLSFKVQQEVQLRTARIALIFSCLENYGEVIKSMPGVPELDADQFDDSFELLVISALAPETLREHIWHEADVQSWLTLDAWLFDPAQPLVVPELPVPKLTPNLQLSIAGAETRESLPLANELSESERLKSIRMQHLVRVDVRQIELLNSLTSELLLTRTRLNQGGAKQIRQALVTLNRLTASLQAVSMKLQTVSASQIFHRYPRMIRDLARSLNKEIRCQLVGENIEIARAYVDDLSSVLLHMIRNAADHGLESPSERQSLGKPRQGLIQLSASYSEHEVVIEIKDDGRGIDTETLKLKAQKHKLMNHKEIEALSTEQALQLIFSPGLSTSAATTDISGRGVGMDVVRNHIHQLGGSVEVESSYGLGTRFTIRLPSDFRQVRSLLVKAEQQYFALPYDQISQIRHASELNGAEPVIGLHNLSTLSGRQSIKADSVLLHIHHAEQSAWIMADELIGAQDLAVRQLLGIEQDIVSGAAMLGSEDVALFLEPSQLLSLLGSVNV